MSSRLTRVVAWSGWLAGVAAIVTAGVISVGLPPQPGADETSLLEDLVWVSTWFGFGLVGALILTHRVRNRIGWVLIGITFGVGLSLVSVAYAKYEFVETGSLSALGQMAAWLATWPAVVTLTLVVFLVLAFPTGSPTSRLGKWLTRALLVLGVVDALVYAVRPGPIEGLAPPVNPLGLPWDRAILDQVTVILGLLIVAVAVGSAVDGALRYRSAQGRTRLQYRWFALSVAAAPVLFCLALLIEGLVLGPDAFDPFVVAFALFGNGIAVAIGIAVSNYGLFEIDRVISRSVSYIALVGFLGLVFAVGAVWLPSLLTEGRSPLFVAASTLVVAALFSPLRHRVQATVDRRFNRSRYDSEQVVETFAGALRNQIDADDLVAGWLGVVARTMQPSSATVWMKND